MTYQGAYIQAWVWVDLDETQQDLTEDDIRGLARSKWAEDGECEIDENAAVSMSEENG